MNFLKEQESVIKKVLEQNGYTVDVVKLIPSSRPDLGEFQYNGIMAIAKQNGENPVELGNKIAEELKNIDAFESIYVAGPGFINLTIKEDSLLSYFEELLKNKNYITKQESKKIIL